MRKLLWLLALSVLTVTAYADDAAKNAFTLNTTAFLDQGALPVLYTCDGKNLSPELDWTNVPAKTQTFALVASDADAPGGIFYHWVLFNIPKATTTFAEGLDKMPAGVMIGKNNFGNIKYDGPCPPRGSAHTYTFTLYALNGKVDLPNGTDAKTVVAALKAHTVGQVSISTVYSRWLK